MHELTYNETCLDKEKRNKSLYMITFLPFPT